MTVGVEYSFLRDGCSLRYWLAGDAPNPVIVFCHGASLDHEMFGPQVSFLVKAGYRVLTWDMRGHGRSKPLGPAFDFQLSAADLLAILEREDLGDIVLVGHSGGGYVAQHLLYWRPDAVGALVTIGSTDLTVRPSFGRQIAYRLMPYLYRVIPDRILRQQFARHMGVSDDVREYALQATSHLSRREFVDVFSAAAKALLNDPAFGKDYRIGVPHLVSFGEHDDTNGGIVKTGARRWAEAGRCAQLLIIPDAGHNANQDNPDHFNTALHAWLKGIRSVP